MIRNSKKENAADLARKSIASICIRILIGTMESVGGICKQKSLSHYTACVVPQDYS